MLGMPAKIGWLFLGLTLLLAITAAKEIRAQGALQTARSQLFSAMLGEEADKALSEPTNARALSEALKEKLERVRDQLTRCENTCPDELKNTLISLTVDGEKSH
jgi:hypothetical protein